MSEQPMLAPERIKILLVDDRASNLLALEAALAAPEYELVKVQSGEEALRFLLDDTCALILMDVRMPGLDGFETARLIRQNERTRDIPIVFVTAFADDEARMLAGYESGAIDYLRKPLQPEVLRSKVAGFAALHRARLEIQRQARLLREHERREHAHAVAELELRALRRQQVAQRRYQTLVEGLSHAVLWVLEPVTLACTFVSPSARPLLGFPVERWLREPGFWLERLPAPDRERLVAAAASLTPGGPPVQLEHQALRADGRLASFETTLRLLADEESGRVELHGLSSDVTHVVEARAATAFLARASDELSRSLDLREIAERAVHLAADFFGAPSVVELDGLPPVGAPVGGAPPVAGEAVAARLRVPELRAAPAGVARPPLPFLPGERDGGPVGDEDAALVLPLAARGRRLGTLCLVWHDRPLEARDLEVAEELARRLTHALENALLHARTEAAVRAREEFLSVASHELRTPLTALHLQVQMLLQGMATPRAGAPPADPALQRRLGVLARQVERLTALVNTLLDLARIRSERLSIELAPCDLAEAVNDAAARFEEPLAASERPFSVDVGRGLVGRFDRTRLEQLATNLIGNAVKHGGTGAIAVTLRRVGGRAVLTVTDTGPGISEAEQARIFEPFSQGRNAARGGLGLGLYIARSIVDAHGGRISVQSTVGQGTTFSVELPLAPAGPAELGHPEQAPEAEAVEAPG